MLERGVPNNAISVLKLADFFWFDCLVIEMVFTILLLAQLISQQTLSDHTSI